MKYIIALSSLLFIGCSSTSNTLNEYKTISGSVTSKTIPSSRLNGAPLITLGQPINGDIIKEDPMFLNEGYASNYDTYKINITIPGEYNINVKALCDCLGFSKILFFPSVHVLDKEMIEVPINDSNVESGIPSDSLFGENIPAHLNADINLIFAETGTYYLIISPYNKNIDKLAFDILLSTNSNSPTNPVWIPNFSVPIKIHPYGKYIATLEAVDAH